ncbi:hypothetical protein [Rhizobium sp.]
MRWYFGKPTKAQDAETLQIVSITAMTAKNWRLKDFEDASDLRKRLRSSM